MECPSCQAPLEGSPRFCPKCGALVPAAVDPEGQPDPLLGTILSGRYRIIKLLGEGGMGAVYLGEQQMGSATRKVAVKTLHPHLSKDPKIMARFQRECGTLSELQHPNTIQVFDFGTTEEGLLYIVMEFIQGPSLADLLDQGGPLEPKRAEKIISQICGSLHEAHSQGIVHRDLKPDNVVLTERAGQKEWVKVLDFGIAKRSAEVDKNEQKLTQQGMVLGTPPYMSPEQFTGQPVDARSDIYSLGVMAYEMLSGKLPFTAQTAWEWATKHMTVAPSPLESPAGTPLPVAMQDAIARALAKHPDDRFPTIDAFGAAFAGKTISDRPASAAGVPVEPRAGGNPERQTVGAPLSNEAQREKTEMGEAMPMPGGAPGAYAPAPYSPPVAAPYGASPPAGDRSYATPPGVVQAGPAGRPKAGGGRGAIAAVLGLVGVVLVGGGIYAVSGKHGSSASDSPSGSASAPSAIVLPVDTASGAPADTASPPPDSTGDNLPSLTGGNVPSGGGGAVSPPHKADSGKTVPAASGTSAPPNPQPTPTTPPKPAPTAPPPPLTPDVINACNLARIFSKPSQKAAHDSAAKRCLEGGGKL